MQTRVYARAHLLRQYMTVLGCRLRTATWVDEQSAIILAQARRDLPEFARLTGMTEVQAEYMWRGMVAMAIDVGMLDTLRGPPGTCDHMRERYPPIASQT